MAAQRLNLDTKIRIERPMQIKDALGHAKGGGFEAVTETWANVAMKSGVRQLLADSDSGKVTASVRMRFRTDIKPGWHISTLRYVNGAALPEAVFVVDALIPDLSGRVYADAVCTLEVLNDLR
jgi:head-tail adaptor